MNWEYGNLELHSTSSGRCVYSGELAALGESWVLSLVHYAKGDSPEVGSGSVCTDTYDDADAVQSKVGFILTETESELASNTKLAEVDLETVPQVATNSDNFIFGYQSDVGEFTVIKFDDTGSRTDFDEVSLQVALDDEDLMGQTEDGGFISSLFKKKSSKQVSGDLTDTSLVAFAPGAEGSGWTYPIGALLVLLIVGGAVYFWKRK